MAKGEFDASVSQSGWFASRTGWLTAASWFDRDLLADTTIEAAGAVTFAAMTGTGSAAVSIDAAGAVPLDAMDGAGTAAIAIDATGAVQLAPMTGAGALVIGDVAINAQGAATFEPMAGSGRMGIGSGVELREVTIVQRIVETRIIMRR